MKITQVAPLIESVPPKYYGGTERVVSYLTEELVRQGHEVTLFASGDSVTAARLVAACPRSLRLDPSCADTLAHQVLMMEMVARRAGEFDVIHYHIDYFHFPISRRIPVPNITTLHGRLDLPELLDVYREFSEMPVVSISDAQRAPIPFANWRATVYHGLPLDLYTFHEKPGDYLAFLGRISPEKRADRAMDIAHSLGLPLKIAAKIDRADQEYYEKQIEERLTDSRIQFVGEVGEKDKDDFLGGALALLFPIDWPEPFGLVMIEAMACGTPVVAFRRGSVAEVVEPGVTGFIVDTVEEAVEAVRNIRTIDRAVCRRAFEDRFSSRRMAADYVTEYERLTRGRLQHANRTEGGIPHLATA